ncbi:SDR family oxidoreductase [Haloarchaeobius amylolyticus]|uniref:SDR family oxidoreductase n=1 Tax=Haloarchaeobius amylolyticus TaxID=1198296 RepID=UPI00226F39FC
MTHDSYRLLVAGASGETGIDILDYLAETDYTARAMTRHGENESRLRRHGADEVVVGDLFDRDDALRAVDGVDGVLCAVGSPRRRFLYGRPVDGDGVQRLVDAALHHDVSYFVFESALGVGDSKGGLSLPERLLRYRVLRAKHETEKYLRESELPHTIIRPGRLREGEMTQDLVVAEGGATVSGSVRRADVAWLMVAALTTPEARNRTFEVVGPESAPGGVEDVVEFDWRGPETGLVATRSDYSIPL